MRSHPAPHALVLIAAAVMIAALAPRVARADATVTSQTLTCTSFTASGTSTAPLVTIYAENTATSEYWFTIVPVVNGSFTGGVTFPQAPTGTSFNVEAWGTLNTYTNFGDSGYYDGGAYFSTDEDIPPCEIPVLGLAGLATLAALLGLAGWCAIRRLTR